MITLYATLQIVQAQAGNPTAVYDGIFFEGHGAPTDATPSRWLFYGDIDGPTVYVNAARNSSDQRPTDKDWLQVSDGLGDPVLTATT